MDKRNQMENPFFDPDKPGSIFVGMDRYHQYIIFGKAFYLHFQVGVGHGLVQ